MGILAPILLVLLELWAARGERSPRYVKGALLGLLLALVLIMFGFL